jgi:ABC-type amino acid transport substrate-binding protein
MTPKRIQDDFNALRWLFELFVGLVDQRPFEAAAVLTVLFVLLVPALANRAGHVIALFRARKLRDGLTKSGVALLFPGLALVAVYAIRAQHRPHIVIERPVANADVVGVTVNAQWSVKAPTPSSAPPLRYMVQERRYGDSAWREVARPPFPRHSWMPRTNTFQWRVKAVRAHDLHDEWTDWSEPQTNSYYSSAYDRIRRTGVVRFAVIDDEEPPYKFYDVERQDDSGITLEVSKLVAKELAAAVGRSVLRQELQPNTWLEGNSADLRNSIADIAVTSSTILTSREERYGISFTVPYMQSTLSIVTRVRDGETDLAGLSGKRVTSWAGTIGEQLAAEASALFVSSASYMAMFEKLDRTEVFAVLDDSYVARHQVRLRANGSYVVHRIQPSELAAQPGGFTYPQELGLYVARGEGALLTALNEILKRPAVKQQLQLIMKQYEDPE